MAPLLDAQPTAAEPVSQPFAARSDMRLAKAAGIHAGD
jgi:hypothetical protein